jgi:zinc protease
MQYKKLKSAALTGLLLAAHSFYSPAQGQETKSAMPHEAVLQFDPAVKTGKLANGFTYYIRHNEEPKHRAVMYLVNKVGSVLEDDDQRGLAHFMEHMSFNGTKNFPKNELVNYLQKVGVRFGADLNAYTSFDETVYQLPIPADKPEVLASGIQIMRDWAQDATLDPEEIDKERGVVLEEKRLGKGADERMRRLYYPVITNNSRYAQRIPIGIDEVLNSFKPQTIKRFYHDWYRPDLQALIIVGDVDVNAIEKVIKAKFADLKNPANERVRTKYAIPLSNKNQFIAVIDPEETNLSLQILIKHTGLKLQTPSDYRAMIVRSLYNQMLAGRYSEILHQIAPPFLSASAGVEQYLGGLDAFSLSVGTKPETIEAAFKAAWREIDRVKQFGFTATELERAKSGFLNAMANAVKEKDRTPSNAFVKEYQQYFLTGTAAPGIEREYEMAKTDLSGITLSEVARESDDYITDNNRDILITAPEKDKASLPDQATVESWVKQVAQEKLEPYKDVFTNQTLLTKQPLAGKIIKEEKNDALGITTLTLNNGIKVILKPTDFKNDQIIFSGYAPGGTSLYNESVYESASAASALISAGGIGNLNGIQLSKYLSGKQIQISPFITDLYQGISGATVNKDLETTLQMLYAYFTEPRKDTTTFNSIMMRSKAALANRAASPKAVFQDSMLTVVYSNNWRRSGPTLEKLQKLKLDDAYRIYQERFSDASNFTFVFVGNLDLAHLRPLLEKYMGSLPATQQHEQFRDLKIEIAQGKIEKTIYKGTEPKATVNLIFSGPYNFSREENMQMEALKEVLQIRITEQLRENESGVYTPQVSVNTSKYPTPQYSIGVSFGCAPENVDKLVASALNEINQLKVSGPPQVNIDKWKAEFGSAMESNLKTNTFWMSFLNSQLQNNMAFLPADSYKERMDKVNTESLKVIAAKYLDGKNYIKLVLMPEK